jgi:CheY-like chemotaxis protein
VLNALLGSAGHSADCVRDGAQAVEAVRKAADAGTPYDGVLMDVMMPGVDGLEAARRIRALPGAAAQLPILAVTASAFAEDIAACHAAGMNGHLAKPIERENLLALLGQIAGMAAPAAPSPAPLLDELAAQPILLRQSHPLVVPGMDPEALAQLTEEFIEEIRLSLAALAEAMPDQRVAPAHRLAGAAATLGAARLAMAARQLQSCRNPGPTEDALAASIQAIGQETLKALGQRTPAGAPA